MHGKDGGHTIPIRRFRNPQVEFDPKVDERVQVLPRRGDGAEDGTATERCERHGDEEDGVRRPGQTETAQGREVQREEEGGAEEATIEPCLFHPLHPHNLHPRGQVQIAITSKVGRMQIGKFFSLSLGVILGVIVQSLVIVLSSKSSMFVSLLHR